MQSVRIGYRYFLVIGSYRAILFPIAHNPAGGFVAAAHHLAHVLAAQFDDDFVPVLGIPADLVGQVE